MHSGQDKHGQFGGTALGRRPKGETEAAETDPIISRLGTVAGRKAEGVCGTGQKTEIVETRRR